MRYFKISVAFLAVSMPLTILAQEDWEKETEIEDVQIEIVKDREINLKSANRNFDKIPPSRGNTQNEPVQYNYSNINFDLPDLQVNIRPLRIKDEKLSKLYGNFVKAGYGNYKTPYFEAFFNSKRSKVRSYGAHVNYLNSGEGPIDGENSASGRMDVDLFGRYFTPKATYDGGLGFNRRTYHFYGYPQGQETEQDTLKQHFNNVYLNGSIEKNDNNSDFQYAVRVQLNYLDDNRDASEMDGQFNLETKYLLSDEAFMKLEGGIDLIAREDDLIERQVRNLFRIRPSFGFDYEDFNIEVGFNAVYENDTLGTSGKMHFYPTVNASYPFSDNLELYAGIGGDIQKNTLRTFSEVNPFINSNLEIYHTNKTFDLYGGIRSKLTSRLNFGAGFSAATFRNMYYFLNSSSDQSKFNVIYDVGNTEVLNLFAELSFNSAKNFRLSARGDYWGYNTNNVAEAWHKPNYKISSVAVYNLFDKVHITAEAYTLGGIKALDQSTSETVALDAFFDLNLKIDYLVSDQFSIFLQANNMLGQEYETFYHYPSRGLQFMGGLTYSF